MPKTDRYTIETHCLSGRPLLLLLEELLLEYAERSAPESALQQPPSPAANDTPASE